jgi:hypothetical protein
MVDVDRIYELPRIDKPIRRERKPAVSKIIVSYKKDPLEYSTIADYIRHQTSTYYPLNLNKKNNVSINPSRIEEIIE